MLSSAAFPDRFTLARKMSVNDILQTLSDEGGKSDDYLLDFAVKIEPIITKHFADLRATYEKLVELVVRQEKYITVLNRCDSIRTADENVNRKLLNDLRNDPLVQSAIERSKG